MYNMGRLGESTWQLRLKLGWIGLNLIELGRDGAVHNIQLFRLLTGRRGGSSLLQ